MYVIDSFNRIDINGTCLILLKKKSTQYAISLGGYCYGHCEIIMKNIMSRSDTHLSQQNLNNSLRLVSAHYHVKNVRLTVLLRSILRDTHIHVHQFKGYTMLKITICVFLKKDTTHGPCVGLMQRYLSAHPMYVLCTLMADYLQWSILCSYY